MTVSHVVSNSIYFINSVPPALNIQIEIFKTFQPTQKLRYPNCGLQTFIKY
jgi:hypothetical protein